MSQMQQGRTAGDATLRRRRLGSVSRRAVGYFVDPGGPESIEAEPDARTQDTAEFAPPDVAVLHTVVLPLTRSGGYEREPVDQRLAELEHELAIARGAAATPKGVEAEIQYLGEETAEILRVAHQKAEALVARATDEADALRTAALADAAAVKSAAEERLRRLDAETELIWAERTRLTDDTRRLSEALRSIADSAVERFPAAEQMPPPVVAASPCLEEPGAGADAPV